MIKLKSPAEVEIMREGGQILAGILEEVLEETKAGVTTKMLDALAEEKIRKAGAQPAFLNYQGFPGTMCTSVNEAVVHAVPQDDQKLKDGDIITLDIGLIHKGFYLDMARTISIGNIPDETQHLITTTKKALDLGISKVKPGVYLGDIGFAIQQLIEKEGFGVVRELCGHGIGKELHEEPQVLNFGDRKTGAILKEGMVICIEPMVTAGDWNVQRAEDGQTYLTKDKSLSAHFEDTIAVTKQGADVLTRPH